MKPVNIVLISVALAVAGTWTRKKTISMPMVVGGAFITLAIVVGEDAAPELTKNFSWLILAATVGAYGDDVFSIIGNVTTGSKLNDPNDDKSGARGSGGMRPK